MKPVCVKCERFYRCKKNGFWFTEGMPKDNSLPPPGLVAPEKWESYKLWNGDLWECPTCKSQIIVGVAREPIREHYQPDFTMVQEQLKANQLLVKDC